MLESLTTQASSSSSSPTGLLARRCSGVGDLSRVRFSSRRFLRRRRSLESSELSLSLLSDKSESEVDASRRRFLCLRELDLCFLSRLLPFLDDRFFRSRSSRAVSSANDRSGLRGQTETVEESRCALRAVKSAPVIPLGR